jgi:hypothetical protein
VKIAQNVTVKDKRNARHVADPVKNEPQLESLKAFYIP